jgi:hypothetical protein
MMVRYQSVEDVRSVRLVLGLRALISDVVHDLVLALSRYAGVGQDHLELNAKRRRHELALFQV